MPSLSRLDYSNTLRDTALEDNMESVVSAKCSHLTADKSQAIWSRNPYFIAIILAWIAFDDL